MGVPFDISWTWQADSDLFRLRVESTFSMCEVFKNSNQAAQNPRREFWFTPTSGRKCLFNGPSALFSLIRGKLENLSEILSRLEE